MFREFGTDNLLEVGGAIFFLQCDDLAEVKVWDLLVEL